MEEPSEDLYDEFGNYVGPDLDDSSASSSSSDEESIDDKAHGDDDDDMSQVSALDDANDPSAALVPLDEDSRASSLAAPQNEIVLHEDKVHYPSAASIYGPTVTTAVLDEDAMDIDTPILEPTMEPSRALAATQSDHDLIVNDDFLTSHLLDNETTNTRRGLALCGNLHSGKTSLLDLLVQHAHAQPILPSNPLPSKYTDRLLTEQARQMSLQTTPITLPLSTSRGKTLALTILDTPGHIQFHDESVASLQLVDGCLLVVDVVQGMTLHDTLLIQHVIGQGLNLMICLNQMDRLICELKLPPVDAYHKIRNVLEEVNDLVQRVSLGRYPKLCPGRGNVSFASAVHGWVFTLESWSQLYVDHVEASAEEDWDDKDEDEEEGETDVYRGFSNASLGKGLTAEEFAKRLWGNTYLDPQSKTFRKRSRDCVPSNTPRTFVQFVLDPIYKLYSACLGESEKDVAKVLRSVGVYLSREELRASAKNLLTSALMKFFGNAAGLVDLIARNVPAPSKAVLGKISRCYTGPQTSPAVKSMLACNRNGPLVIHVTKLFPSNAEMNSPKSAKKHSSTSPAMTVQSFSALGRIYSGSVKPGQKVRVLGEAYSPDDDEDMAFATVDAVSIPRGRFRTPVSIARAGNWVLLDGVDASITKTATIVDCQENEDEDDSVQIFAPLKFAQVGGEAVMKLSVEPLNPAELPKMVEGLRRISKSYPMARTRVEESGEHVLFGTGELYLDCAMHDLRHTFSDIEVKVADPVVGFRETVVDTSSIKCFAETANKRNKLTMISEPLDEGLAEQIEVGKINIRDWDQKKLGRYFQKKYDWDLLSARSVWAFGDSATHGPNILMDDTLPSEVDKALLNSCKSSIVQGFQWATREGPLCEEPVRSTKLKLLDVVLADKPIHRGAGQVIPTARKVVHSSILTASPRLMEPIYRLEIQCPGEIVDAIHPILNKRRGHIVHDRPIPGSPLYSLNAFIPVMDSFGFETDLRTYTQGQAMVYSVFDHWAIVPGDPLDRSIILHPLEPSPTKDLARDFLVKTRRRKGLSEDVSVVKFFDEGMREQLDS